jgi:hypothetical protein
VTHIDSSHILYSCFTAMIGTEQKGTVPVYYRCICYSAGPFFVSDYIDFLNRTKTTTPQPDVEMNTTVPLNTTQLAQPNVASVSGGGTTMAMTKPAAIAVGKRATCKVWMWGVCAGG